MLRPSLYSLYTGSYVWIIWFIMLRVYYFTVSFFHGLSCRPFSAGLGHQQPDWLRHQYVLQHECVGTDLGQSRLSCLQLLTKVSTFVVIFFHGCMTDNLAKSGNENLKGTVHPKMKIRPLSYRPCTDGKLVHQTFLEPHSQNSLQYSLR